MNDYTFTIRSTIDEQDRDSLSVRVYDSIADASLVGPDDDGAFLIEFERRAPEFAPAVTGAVDELRSALPDAVILRVDDGDLATAGAGRGDESVLLRALNEALDLRRLASGLDDAERGAIAWLITRAL